MRSQTYDPDTGLAPNSPAAIAVAAPCLRDNECSQQQLVRLVGYRGPIATNGSFDRLRRAQAAFQDAGLT